MAYNMLYNIHKAHNSVYNYDYIISKNIVRRYYTLVQ